MPTTGRRWTSVEVTGPLTGKIHLKNPSPAVWLIALADGSGVIISKKAFESARRQVQDDADRLRPLHPQGMGAARPFHAGRQPRLSRREAGLRRDRRQADRRRQDGAARAAGGRDRFRPHRSGRRQGHRERARHQGREAVGDRLCLDRPEHREEAVRRRAACARRSARRIDVPAIIAAAYNGAVEPAYALEAPGILGYWKDAPKHERDVEGAKKLLEEAGQGGGFSTKLTVLNKAVSQATAAVVQANLAEIGIDVQIDALDEGAYWAYGENDASKDLELVLVEYRGKFDPGFQTQWFTVRPDRHLELAALEQQGVRRAAQAGRHRDRHEEARADLHRRAEADGRVPPPSGGSRTTPTPSPSRTRCRRASCPTATSGSTPRSSRLERSVRQAKLVSARPSRALAVGDARRTCDERILRAKAACRATSSAGWRLPCWCWSAAWRCSAR